MDDAHIDSLLERYLSLLDEYTRLRDRLVRIQSGVHQSIARANFSAERGMRYGQDQYDGRMQASRVVDISTTTTDSDVAVFDVRAVTSPDEEEEEEEEEDDDDAEAKEEKDDDAAAGEETEKKEKKKESKPVDPLRWFGLLTPMPLRNAQTLSIEAVEEVIPRLASIDSEMKNLEIEVRRARKKRAKASAGKKGSTAQPENEAVPDAPAVVAP